MPVVYAAEREAGLEELVRSTASVTYATLAEVGEVAPLLPDAVARRVKAAQDGGRNFDLFPLKSVLATVGWNKNDDVFDKKETWAARHTPEDKPFNYEHDQDDIIGHITGTFVVGADGSTIADDTVVDDLPDKFHIVNTEVLYRCWEAKAKQERMDTIIAEIGEGKRYVSMEALFKDFDYALADSQGRQRVVARNEQTAFLTKHLRAYGGKGIYQGQKVGRILKDFTFSGKGLVLKPANPESIILTTAQVSPTSEDFSQTPLPVGYAETTGKENTMTELETALKSLEAARAEIETLKTQLREGDTKALKAKAETLEADLKARADELVKTQSELSVAQKACQEMKESLSKTQADLADLQAKQKRADRVAVLAKRLELDDTKAGDMADKLTDLSDEAFTAHADYLAEKLGEYKSAQRAEPNVIEPKVPPAATSQKPQVQPIPKATSAPAPAAGAPKEVKTLPGGATPPIAPVNVIPQFPDTNAHAAETDPGAANADVTALETAKPNVEPALAASVVPPAAEKVRTDIHTYMASHLKRKVETES